MPKFKAFLLVSVFCCLCGCYKIDMNCIPEDPPVPSDWKHPNDEPEEVPLVDDWWEIFDDARLNELEEIALENNRDIYIVLERVTQSRAILSMAYSNFFPQLNLNSVYTNQDSLIKIFGPTGNIFKDNLVRAHNPTNLLPLDLSYEVDLWGTVRYQYKSALYSLQAQIEAYQTSILILTSDVASTYFQIRALDTKIDLFEKTMVTRKKALDINQSRYDYKIISFLDVAQAEVELSNVESQYYDSIRLRELQVDRMAVLLGMPASCLSLESSPLAMLPPKVPAGIPSDILKQRPDIKEAERFAASEQALVGVAFTSFFPSLTLTGSLGYTSPVFKDFLTWFSRLWSYGALVNQTVFDGGEKFAELKYAESQFRQATLSYQQTVLVAFQEVEDALASIEWLDKEIRSVEHSVKYAKKSYQISMDRYVKGLSFYLDVVNSEQEELDNERALIDLITLDYLSTIQLIKALGGSWSIE